MSKMASATAFAFLSIFTLLLFSSFSAFALDIDIGIGIGIGGGHYGPSPPEPPDCNTSSPPPPPPSFATPVTSPKKSPPPPPPPSPPPSPPPPSPPPSPPPPSPPPPPPPKTRRPRKSRPRSPPPRFASPRIEIAFNVIQNYKDRIEGDPLNVKATWKGRDVCNYKGFMCDVVPDFKQLAVSGLSFNNFNFSGSKLTLDGLVDKLPDIAFFHANSNFFFSPIPTQLGRVKYFYELDLSNNKYAGVFPTQVLGATNLTFLDLRFNNYYGRVPSELFDMDIITAIFLNNNKFGYQLPANLGNTPARYLTFTSNQFTGPIPKSLGAGKTKNTLVEVLFSDNNLSGCLPMEIGLLRNAILFDASKNSLTGQIPNSFCCLSRMEVLNFADNRLYSAVPDAVCKLPNLKNFTLSNNFFSEVGPVCRKLIENKILDVSGNCIFDLPNQRSKEECASFYSKRQLCSDQKSMEHVPCVANKYLYEESAAVGPHPRPRKAAEMRTYAALVPNN